GICCLYNENIAESNILTIWLRLCTEVKYKALRLRTTGAYFGTRLSLNIEPKVAHMQSNVTISFRATVSI
ncbi:hypothetical protein, partial [Porphyromonas levii]|uniref:hypothetical protein n=1 Tax=Porphyromonas levii TaxID=28114 RepID=UPI001B8D78C7